MASLAQALDFIGGEQILHTPATTARDLIELVRQGLPIQAVDALVAQGHLTLAELDHVVMPRKTLYHRRKLGRLTAGQSDRLLRVAHSGAGRRNLRQSRQGPGLVAPTDPALGGRTAPESARYRGRRAGGGAVVGAHRARHRRLTFPVRLWRLTRAAHADLSGEGARRYGGRWNSPGRAVVYAAAEAALAVLEVRVHLDLPFDLLPDDDVLLTLETGGLRVEEGPALNDPVACRAYGDRWLAERRSALLGVPSVIVPESHDVLINPAHPTPRASTSSSPGPGPSIPGCFDRQPRRPKGWRFLRRLALAWRQVPSAKALRWVPAAGGLTAPRRNPLPAKPPAAPSSAGAIPPPAPPPTRTPGGK